MPKYKVLGSAGHNYAHSFVSDTNMGPHDFVACYILRVARTSGVTEFAVDLMATSSGVPEVFGKEVAEAVDWYRRGFLAHVERSGAAPDMVRAAVMRVRAIWPPAGISPAGAVRGYLECEIQITDDRGKQHTGKRIEQWTCSMSRLPW